MPLSGICSGRPGWKLISSRKVTPAWLDHPEKPLCSKSDTDGACDLARASFLREAQGLCLASSVSSRVSRESLCSRQVLIMSTTKRRGEGDRAPAAGPEERREKGGTLLQDLQCPNAPVWAPDRPQGMVSGRKHVRAGHRRSCHSLPELGCHLAPCHHPLWLPTCSLLTSVFPT